MNRRDFLGLFAKTSAAGAAAATGLIALPETHRPIELLEPHRIIKNINELMIFHHIISFRYIHNENLTMHGSIGNLDIYPVLGRLEGYVEVEAYLETPNGVAIDWREASTSTLRELDETQNLKKVMFDCQDLKGKLFILSGYEINSMVGKDARAIMKAHEIRSNGALV